MNEGNSNTPNRERFLLYNASHLKSAYIAAIYTLLALVNFLLYSPTPFEVLGFTADPIGWWAMATVPFTIAFCILTIKLARQGRLHNASPNQKPDAMRQPKVMLIVLAILFALPNVLIAFLHINGIRAGFAYWGQVRAAYEVPFFHLLPMVLLFYWWLSSLHHNQGV